MFSFDIAKVETAARYHMKLSKFIDLGDVEAVCTRTEPEQHMCVVVVMLICYRSCRFLLKKEGKDWVELYRVGDQTHRFDLLTSHEDAVKFMKLLRCELPIPVRTADLGDYSKACCFRLGDEVAIAFFEYSSEPEFSDSTWAGMRLVYTEDVTKVAEGLLQEYSRVYGRLLGEA